MASFSLRIFTHHEKKSDKYMVRLAVAHNGDTRYVSTGVQVDNTMQFRNGRVTNRPDANILNTRLQGFIAKYETALSELQYTECLSCTQLLSALRDIVNRKSRNAGLEATFKEFIENSRLVDSSKSVLTSGMRHALKVLGDIPIGTLCYQKIVRLESELRKKRLSNSTIVLVMAALRRTVTYARRCGYVPEEFRPFRDYTEPQPDIRDSWLTPEQLIKLRDAKLYGAMQQTTRDYIMLSFYLGGINIADLLSINFKALRHKRRLKYIRNKTKSQQKANKYVEFDIPDEAMPYIEKYMRPDGYLGTKYQRKDMLHSYFSQSIKSLREQTGLHNLIYYSARKTFAQIAFNLGIPTGVIDFILGHKLNKQGRTLYNYIYVSPEKATDAIRRVLDFLK